jgi:hypothetical protein
MWSGCDNQEMTRMTISRSVAAAMLVQIALAAPANAGLATTGLPAGRIYIKPGESPIKALHDAQFDARTASRIAAWRAAGHRALPGSAPPAITAGAVTASTLTAGQPGQYPSMSFTYQASAGLASVNFVFTSPNGQAYNFADYFEVAYATSGTISYASISQLSPWSQPGKWTLSAIKITDLAGTSTIYQAAQVAALFPAKTYTVVNTGLSDGIPPKVIRGSLPSPTVSLSSKFPLLKASITASDSGSGLWLAYVQFQPPGSTLQYYEDVPVPLPVAKGAINADTIFASYDSPGTYAIVGYGVCDFAQNCTIDNNDADIVKLFGTDSFTLTP